MHHDVIVVGGSYSGMAAALQLVRARRSVLVIDAQSPRNRAASHSHGFLAQDGIPPGEILRVARAQLEKYPTLTWINGKAVALGGEFDNFVVTTEDEQQHYGRRIIFATGVTDELPAIPGLQQRWGRTAAACPYCHGYEVGGGAIGVIATGPMSTHHAELVTEWGDVTLFTNDTFALDDETRATLVARNVTIEPTTIARIDGDADVVLTDGRRMTFNGLFVATRTAPASDVPGDIGCELEETPMGVQVRTDASKQTSLKGVFACGDVAYTPHSITLAVGDGAMTGMHVHRSLVWPEN